MSFAHRFRLVAVALGIVLFASCESTEPTLHVVGMHCTGGDLAGGVVTSVCGGAVSSTVETIRISVGPTTATDIHGFHFDLLYDSTHLAYVDSSAAAGSLLAQGGFSPALSVTYAGGAPGHLVVDVHRGVAEAGVSWNPNAIDVVTLQFSVNPDSNFPPSPIQFQSPSALDSTGAEIAGLAFRDGVRLSYE